MFENHEGQRELAMKHVIAAALVMCLSASAYGAVGDLAPKAGEPDRYGGSILQMQAPEAPKPAPAGCGTVNPNAKIITMGGSASSVVVAFDAEKADAKILDVLRIDSDGTGKFTADASIPIAWPAPDGTGSAQIGPATITLVRDGRKVPVTVKGVAASSTSGMASMFLIFSTCLEGQCAIGDKTYTVRLVDTTGNFRAADAAKVTLKDGVPVDQGRGDAIWVAAGEGAQLKSVGSLGQPFLMDGRWYEMSVSADQSKVTASAVKGPFGKIKVDADQWQARLVGTERVIAISGGKEPVEVPAGKYAVLTGSMTKSKVLAMMTDSRFAQGKAAMFEVPADKTVENPFGQPLATSVEVTLTGRNAIFMPTVTDAGGRFVGSFFVLGTGVSKSGGQFEVTDADGKIVYSASLEFS
jgi:hypothetical protein